MKANLSHVLQHLRKVADTPTARDLTDSELLQRFCNTREETAFALLVQRHGPMVLGVCRRLLRDPHDAEDAFQAAFLVLARKADSIRQHDSLGSWLYGVAYRVAAKARAGLLRRRTREAPAVIDVPAAAGRDEPAWQEVRLVLDEEIGRLPMKYRVPVVLCFLEGKTHEQAARELDWPKSSVSARLGRARQLLQTRLTRRGLALSAGLLAVALTEEASAAVPAQLTLSAVRLAVSAATGPLTAAAPAVALAESVVKGMSALKLLLVAGAVLGISLVVAAVGTFARPHQAAQAPTAGKDSPGEKAKPAKTADAGPARTDRFGDPLPPGAVARLGTVRLRHGDEVLAGVFTPDAKTLITSSQDGTIRVWDTASGKEVRRLGGQHSFAAALALTADAKTLVGRGASELLVWDLAGRAEPRTIRTHPIAFMNVAPMALSPDGKTVATSGRDRTVCLWDLASGNQIHKLEGHKDIIPALAFAPDGRTLASGSYDKTVRLWAVADGAEQKQLMGHLGQVWSLGFSRDGKTLASGGNEGVLLWDVATGNKERSLPAAGLASLLFTPDCNLLAGGELWDPATGKRIPRFGESVYRGCLSPDGKTLASWGQSVIRLWDFASGKERQPSGGHEWEPRSLAFAPDGKRIVSGSWRDPAVLVWDAATGKELDRWKGTPIQGALGGLLGGGSDHPTQDGATAVAFSPDGKLLAAGHGLTKATLHLWDAAAGKEVRGFATGQPSIFGLAFSPDGKTLVSASYDQQLCLWESATGKPIRRINGPNGQHKALAFSADSKTLTVAGGGYERGDYEIQAFDVATGTERHHVSRKDGPVASLALSPDGRWLAVAGFNQNGFRLIDRATDRELSVAPRERGLEVVAFAPDGKSVAAAGHGKVRVFEVATGKERILFEGHQGTMNTLAFAPDGNRLASASRDMTILVWDLVGQAVAKEDEALWTDLAANDPAKAYQAMQVMIAGRVPAASLVQKRLHPAPTAEPGTQEMIDRLLQQLDSAKFEERERAAKELDTLGARAEPSLRKAIVGQPSLETRRRLETLLDRLDPTRTAEGLRMLRALEVLERRGGAEARRVLEKLAGGAAEATLTREAKASLDRLNRRSLTP